jgi:hypothetical protein|tara:strand:- start:2229 stop:2468 length:240 start_codon:yes stop_codon:yes gene_type:complete
VNKILNLINNKNQRTLENIMSESQQITSKDVVSHLMQDKTSEFKQGVSDLLMQKAKDAVDLKKIEVGQSLFNKEIPEEE